MPPDRLDPRTLAAMSRDCAPAAADHLAEQGADTPAVLRLFAQGTLSREVLAEWCPQAPDLADGLARRREVLAAWFPEAEVLAENVIRSYGSHTSIPWLVPGYPRVTVHEYALGQVRGYLASGTDAPGTLYEVRQECDAALAAFRRRVLRLFPEVTFRLTCTISLMEWRDVARVEGPMRIDSPGVVTVAGRWGERFWSSWPGEILRRGGFASNLGLRWWHEQEQRRVAFVQDQSAEYLLGDPPDGIQVGDTLPCRGMDLRDHDGTCLVLSRPDAQGYFRVRTPDGHEARIRQAHGTGATCTVGGQTFAVKSWQVTTHKP